MHKSRNIYGGGAVTNKNGLSFEENTSLNDEITVLNKLSYGGIKIKFNNHDKILIKAEKRHLLKYMKSKGKIKFNTETANGCKQPDDCYIDENAKVIFVIEKKCQKQNGSTCEKIQTGVFKREHYNEIFPNYKVIYIYCFNEWFRYKCEPEKKYLLKNNIPIFWGETPTYKEDIIDFITSYKSEDVIESKNDKFKKDILDFINKGDKDIKEIKDFISNY